MNETLRRILLSVFLLLIIIAHGLACFYLGLNQGRGNTAGNPGSQARDSIGEGRAADYFKSIIDITRTFTERQKQYSTYRHIEHALEKSKQEYVDIDSERLEALGRIEISGEKQGNHLDNATAHLDAAIEYLDSGRDN